MSWIVLMTDVLQFTYIHTIYYVVNLFVVILSELCTMSSQNMYIGC